MEVIDSGRLVPCTDEWWENPEAEIARPLFGIWIYNYANNTQQPVVLGKEGRMFAEAVSLEPRAPATFIPPVTNNGDVGTLHIRSVYDGNLPNVDTDDLNLSALSDPSQTTADERPARFLRIVKAVSIADDDTLDEQDDNVYGNRFNQNNGLREIIGYTPIEPDGSVLVEIPADIAFTLEVVDRHGARISNNSTFWMQLRPGERRECNGCLSTTPTQPVSRADVVPESINPGAAGGVAFPGTARFDSLGTPETPTAGETMAEFAARTFFAVPGAQPGDADTYLSAELRTPSVDIEFIDEWTNPALAPTTLRSDPFAFRYLDLVPGDQTLSTTKAPLKNKGCLSDWNATCRTVINYENHIQYIWERDRPVDIDPDLLLVSLAERRCTGCHTRSADGVLQLPAGQLELTNAPSTDGHMTSYRELLFESAELELTEGSLTPRVIDTGECNVDAEGNELRDENGVCTDPILEIVTVPPIMARGGALASGRFFNRFSTFNAVTQTVDHRGFLNPSELKLLREWLDLSGRYYNNPFDSADPIEDQ